MKYFILLIPALLLLISCINNDIRKIQQSAYASIQSGSLHIGNDTAIIVAVENNEQWKDLQMHINAYQYEEMSDMQNIAPNHDWQKIKVDFDKEILLLLIDQQKGNPAFKTYISRVEENEKTIEVYWETKPIESGAVSMVMSSPYHIYKMPKTNKQIIIK